MKSLSLKTAGLLLIMALAHSTMAQARGEQGGGVDITGDFNSHVTTDNVTQLTLGNDNTSDLLVGSVSGNVRMNNFTSTVQAKNVTQLTLGNGNTSSLLLGSASSH
jgi:hypothetical protein